MKDDDVSDDDSIKKRISMDFEPVRELGPMSLGEIIIFRKSRIDKYSQLKIYPADYDLSGGANSRIYGSVREEIPWTKSASFFLSNPYLLIVLTYAGYSTPVDTDMSGVVIEYGSGRILQAHKGLAAERWFNQLYKYQDSSGIVRVNMVNAYDAGFKYAFLDLSRSANVDGARDKGRGNIADGVYGNPGFYHAGKKGKNNLSPADPRGWLKVIKRDVFTKLFIKLWRENPKSPYSSEDFGYLIEIDPGSGSR